MGIAGKLRRLDKRVLPRKKTVQFDAAEPWWFTFGGLIGAMLGLAVVWIPRLFDGTPRLLVLAVVVGLLVAYVLKVKTWRQQHRVPKVHSAALGITGKCGGFPVAWPTVRSAVTTPPTREPQVIAPPGCEQERSSAA